MTWGAVGVAVVGGVMAQRSAKKQAQAAADAQAQALGYQDAAQQRNIEEQQRQFDLTRQDTATQRAVGDKALNYLSSVLMPQAPSRFTDGGSYLLPRGEDGQIMFGSGQEPTYTADGTMGTLQGFTPQRFQMGEFTTDPGYQFRLEQGAKARQIGLGAQGMQLSGRAQKELERYGQDVGSQEYGNVYARRMGEFQQTEADKQNYLANLSRLAGYGAEGIRTSTSAGGQAAANIGQGALQTGANQANIASQYGTNLANIYGGRAQNIGGAITGGIQNYLAMQQQNRMNDLFRSQQAGDAYMPAATRW